MLREGTTELDKKALSYYNTILDVTKTSTLKTKNSVIIQHLLNDMVEQSVIKDFYIEKVKQLSSKLREKELTVYQLLDTEQTRNELVSRAHNVPDLAIKLAALMASLDRKTQTLVSILKDFLLNRGRKLGKRWNNETKSLFAINLDYGGPALSKFVSEKIGVPQLHTIFSTARCSYVISTKLEEISFESPALFYKSIGCSGLFLLAIDATAITRVIKVRGNRIVGLATNDEVLVTSAQDIVNNENLKKAKQANAFLLTPLQEKVPAFLLAISSVYKGQDYTSVRHWYNQAKLWGGRNT